MGGWFADWVEAERGRFILLLPIAMGAAILVYFALPTEPPLWLGCLLALASLAAIIAGWRYPPTSLLAALALAASLGFARAELRTAAAPPLAIIPYAASRLATQALMPPHHLPAPYACACVRTTPRP